MIDKDHPHAYGDKSCLANSSLIVSGSSPRVWGQATANIDSLRNCGIIPTRMGTRGFCWSFRKERKDHPHAYGDKELCSSRFIVYIGSSPRVWGQEYQKALYRL